MTANKTTPQGAQERVRTETLKTTTKIAALLEQVCTCFFFCRSFHWRVVVLFVVAARCFEERGCRILFYGLHPVAFGPNLYTSRRPNTGRRTWLL